MNQINKLNEMHNEMKTIIKNQNKIMDKLKIEIWKQIDGYNYNVSTFGRVRNNKTNRILKPVINCHGYYYVNLSKDGNGKTIKIHRLVAIAFIDNREDKKCVDHINNNRLSNHINNLRWATLSENQQNASMSKNNTSGTKGISWHKQNKKWQVLIRINGKNRHIGLFINIDDAKKARQKAAKKHYGEYINDCEL